MISLAWKLSGSMGSLKVITTCEVPGSITEPSAGAMERMVGGVVSGGPVVNIQLLGCPISLPARSLTPGRTVTVMSVS